MFEAYACSLNIGVSMSFFRMEDVYDHVDDVDLFVGGFSENKEGSILGPTFKCMVGDVFAR